MNRLHRNQTDRLFSEIDSSNIIKKYELIIKTFDHIKTLSKIEFIGKLLNDIFDLIPEAQRGSYYEQAGEPYIQVFPKGKNEFQGSGLSPKIEEFFVGFETCSSGEIEVREVSGKATACKPINPDPKDVSTYKEMNENHSTLYAPIFVADANVGVLCIDNFSGHSFSALSKSTMKYFAQFISSHFEHKINQERFDQVHVELIQALISSIEVNDPYTEGHGKRVGYYAERLGNFLGLSSDSVAELETAGLLHDIGKLGIPTDILNKRGKLQLEEQLIIQKHPGNTKKILEKIKGFNRISQYTYCHHEKFDGSGYPRGLKGKEIPYESQILSVADAFDAMTSNRAYRNAMTASEAAVIILDQSGKQFDPELSKVAAMLLPILHHMMVRGVVKEQNFDAETYGKIVSR